MGKYLYRNFQTIEEIERQLLFLDTVPDYGPYIEAYAVNSENARCRLKSELNVPYGPTIDEYVDIFPASKANAPIMICVHGGAWLMLSAKDYSYVATGLAANDITSVMVNYSLCPKVGIDEITRQVRASVAWTYRNAGSFGGDPDQIYISGHSAGGHLAAMCMNTDWEKEYDLPRDIIKGVIPVSAVFDLTPMRYTAFQSALQLTGDVISRNSPGLLPIENDFPPVFLTFGENDPEELKQQSRDMAERMKNAGLSFEIFEQAGLNHFQTTDGFEKKDSELLTRILKWKQSKRKS